MRARSETGAAVDAVCTNTDLKCLNAVVGRLMQTGATVLLQAQDTVFCKQFPLLDLLSLNALCRSQGEAPVKLFEPKFQRSMLVGETIDFVLTFESVRC